MAWPDWASTYGLMIAPNNRRDGGIIAFVQNMHDNRLNVDCLEPHQRTGEPFRYMAYLTEETVHEWSPFTVGLGVKPPPKTVWDRLVEDDE